MSSAETIAIVIIVGVAGVFLFAGLYAVIYGLIARFGMNARLNALRSYWAAFLGIILGFLFMAAVNVTVFYRGVGGLGYALVGFGGLALVMTAINVLIVRTKEGGRISFIQGFMLQLVPNVLLIMYALATRPQY